MWPSAWRARTSDQYITSRGGVIYYDIEVAGVKSTLVSIPKQGVTLLKALPQGDLDPPVGHSRRHSQVTLINGGIAEELFDRAWATWISEWTPSKLSMLFMLP